MQSVREKEIERKRGREKEREREREKEGKRPTRHYNAWHIVIGASGIKEEIRFLPMNLSPFKALQCLTVC
jgi:hypothetical protein